MLSTVPENVSETHGDALWEGVPEEVGESEGEVCVSLLGLP